MLEKQWTIVIKNIGNKTFLNFWSTNFDHQLLEVTWNQNSAIHAKMKYKWTISEKKSENN